MNKIIFSKYSNERHKNYKIRTDIFQDAYGHREVVKTAVSKESFMHIENMYQAFRALEYQFASTVFEPNKGILREGALILEYVQGQSLENILDELLEHREIDAFLQLIRKYVEVIRMTAIEDFVPSESYFAMFGEAADKDLQEKSMPINDIDMIFSNIVMVVDRWVILDYEWTFNISIPVNYILYRTAHYYMVADNKGLLKENDINIYECMGVPKDKLGVYEKMEECFQKYMLRGYEPIRFLYKNQGKRQFFPVKLVTEKELERIRRNLQILMDYGNGFERLDYFIDAEPDEQGNIILDFEVKPGLRIFRLDPAQIKCIVYVNELKGIANSGIVYDLPYESNGVMVDGQYICFDDSDPQIWVNELPIDLNRIHVNMNIGYMNELMVKFSKGVAEKCNAGRVEMQNAKSDLQNIKSELQNAKLELRYTKSELENKEENLNIFQTNLKIVQNELDEVRNNYKNLLGLYNEKERILTEVLNSQSWELSKPIRYIGRVGRRVKILRISWKTIKSLKREGFIKTLRKIKKKILGKIYKFAQIPCFENQIVTVPIPENEERILDINQKPNIEKSIAVHLHLFYEDLLDEMLAYINHIPYKFDLYISCQEGADEKKIRKKAKHLNCIENIIIEPCKNQGRDIAPLYVQFGDRISKYDYFLHIHTKKSLYSGYSRMGWRQYNLNCLIGREDNIRRIFEIFESERNVGLIFPEAYDMPLVGFSWLKNLGLGRNLCEKMKLEFFDGLFNYPAGSFFWARTDSLKRIFDLNLSIDNFPVERGQTDGTLAHALERILPFCVHAEGQEFAIIDVDDGVVRYGKSIKPFRDYFEYDLDSVKAMLVQNFDIISFDIFDTLITRLVYDPDDIFTLIQKRIENQYGISLDYLHYRKKAERLAWEKKGAYTNIYDIYSEMPNVFEISKEMADEWLAIEVETEIKISIPRKEVIELMNYLSKNGKKIILVSDMYLTTEIINRLLIKCGCKQPYELWISCEKGKRKDTDELWEEFFSKFDGNKCMHLGDNLCSDNQLLLDRKKNYFTILNPRHMFQLTDYFEKYKKYLEKGVENSFALGMLVNEGMFNSPFVFEKNTGNIRLSNYDDIGFSAFGPLFTTFIQWLYKNTNNNQQLWFLAREGYLLQKMYNCYYVGEGKRNKAQVYFLASRRAVTVAGIRNIEDLKDTLSKQYIGYLDAFLYARLGIVLFNEMENIEVRIPEDLDKVMELLRPHYQQILKKCEAERKNYLSYVREIKEKYPKKQPIVIDVGYSGTIQYYLSKLMEERIDGYYLCTLLTKPDKIGCLCNALYKLDNDEKFYASKVNKDQLFLEALLKAPYGQLCYMVENEGRIEPILKQDDFVSEEVVQMQQGVLKFISQYSVAMKEFQGEVIIDEDLAEEIFDDLLTGDILSIQQLAKFNVQDDYCSNGKLVYDISRKGWGVN